MQTFIVVQNDQVDAVLRSPEGFLKDLERATSSGEPLELGGDAGMSLGMRHNHDPALVLFGNAGGVILGHVENRHFDPGNEFDVMEIVKDILFYKRYKLDRIRGY